MENLHFFLLTALILSSFFVLLPNNPVHSVLFLIFSLCNAAAILFLFNVEFLGLVFIIIYVGAIAVLFLFVVMMLSIKTLKSKLAFFLPFIFLISFVFFLQAFIILEKSFSNFDFYINTTYFVDSLCNIDVIGQSLYNYYAAAFLEAGIILLVAMLGSICLTLNFSSLRQNELSSRQLTRSKKILSFFF